MNKNLKKDIFVMGFALFAMFFGAGNLIFPPFLGWFSGKSWVLGFLCFILVDVGLSLITLIVVAMIGKGAIGISEKLGKKVSMLIMILNVICIGPLIAIPRTSATTYEFMIRPIIPSVSLWEFSAIYFLIVIFLCIKQSKVIDIVGAILAPVMFIALMYLILKGVTSPLGEITLQAYNSSVVKEGILAGYQTMDMMAAIVFSSGVIIAIKSKGYTDKKHQFKIISLSGIVAAVALFIVYGGLTYIGATASSIYPEVAQSELLIKITDQLIGRNGVIVLGIIVGIACMTTSIGLVSSSSSFFVEISNEKFKYTHLVILFSFISYLISTMGIDTIIQVAAPILDLIYPVLLILVFLGLFEKKITNKNVYVFSSLAAFVVCVIALVEKNFGSIVVNKLPFYKYGFAWVVPAIIFGILGNFVNKKNKKNI